MLINEPQMLPAFIPTSEVIGKLSALGNLVCLSGSWGQETTSHPYDIISAAPSALLIERQGVLSLKGDNDLAGQRVTGFDWLERYFSALGVHDTPKGKIPTIFGFIGYLGYDYGRQLEKLPTLTVDEYDMPDLCGGIYHWNFINDRQNGISYLAFGPHCTEKLKSKVIKALESATTKDNIFGLNSKFRPDVPYESYLASFERINGYINDGDCYQINYAHRHQAQFHGDPADAYNHLNETLNTPYSAYLDFNDHQVLSLSPERFIKVKGDRVETRPIKGTVDRGKCKSEDQRLVDQLKNSKKDRAENLMIVDLLRNDLNRTCLPGTVKVPKLFDVETYPNVHHLVSTVTGQKPHHTSPLEVLKQAFPGGSITGAPKVRAMEIIEELEHYRRSIYCGSILYVDFDGSIDSNICIRSLLCKDRNIYCWGGGGIVADSNCEDEYAESITKVKNLMSELEKISWPVG